jgi:hypothetical protein
MALQRTQDGVATGLAGVAHAEVAAPDAAAFAVSTAAPAVEALTSVSWVATDGFDSAWPGFWRAGARRERREEGGSSLTDWLARGADFLGDFPSPISFIEFDDKVRAPSGARVATQDSIFKGGDARVGTLKIRPTRPCATTRAGRQSSQRPSRPV